MTKRVFAKSTEKYIESFSCLIAYLFKDEVLYLVTNKKREVLGKPLLLSTSLSFFCKNINPSMRHMIELNILNLDIFY